MLLMCCSVDVDQTGGVFTLTQPVPGISWRLIGIGNAPEYFTVESNTGIVRIKKPLAEDNSENYALKVCYIYYLLNLYYIIIVLYYIIG